MVTCTIELAATPDEVWAAITEPGCEPRLRWSHRTLDIAGYVVECDAPTRLVVTWANPSTGAPIPGGRAREWHEGPSMVTFTIGAHDIYTRLTVVHDNLVDRFEEDALGEQWAKTLLALDRYLASVPSPA